MMRDIDLSQVLQDRKQLKYCQKDKYSLEKSLAKVQEDYKIIKQILQQSLDVKLEYEQII